jgi:hypothetical protein
MKFEFKNKKKKIKFEIEGIDYFYISAGFESVKAFINGFFYRKKITLESI